MRALGVCLALTLALAAAPSFGAGSAGLSGKVNVNTASVEELQLLPGIGESRARAVVEARKQRGGFEAVEELLEVKGIGDASLERLKPYVTLEGKTTASKP